MPRFPAPRTFAAPLTPFIVNTLGDAGDAAVGDGRCDIDGSVSGDQCTLRAAILETTVGFSHEIGFSLPANSTIVLDAELPALVGDTTINGPGASLLTVQRNTASGTPHFRIFRASPGSNVTVTITGLTITNGRAPDGPTDGQFGSFGTGGGGIFNAGPGLLILRDVVVSGNRAGDGGAGSAVGGSGGSGGGILNSGSLTLINSIVTNNRAGNGGAGGLGGNGGGSGGVTGGSNLTIISSTISNNFAGDGGNAGPGNTGGPGGRGGGIGAGSPLFIISSTISGNRSGRGGNGAGFHGAQGGDGGGILSGGALTMVNTTVSNNIAGDGGVGTVGGGLGGYGGGIYSSNFVNMTNSTIVVNRTTGFFPGLGGGIYKSSIGRIDLKNTIVANNTVPDGGTGPDLSGEFNSQDYNLIKNPNGATFTGTTTHNIVGVDPVLGSLANNGGPTQTHALLAGSPAIAAGSNANLALDDFDLDNDGNKTEAIPFDQRGATFPRVAHTTVDIGAFEQQNLLAAPIRLMLDTSGPAVNQAVAMESLLLLRDPFPVVNTWNPLNPGPDRNTRVVLFVTNLQLPSGEPSSAVRINLIDANNQTHDVGAESVRPVPGFDLTQVTFRIPDNLPAGPCMITVKFQEQVSNSGSIRIGS